MFTSLGYKPFKITAIDPYKRHAVEPGLVMLPFHGGHMFKGVPKVHNDITQRSPAQLTVPHPNKKVQEGKLHTFPLAFLDLLNHIVGFF